MEGEKYFHNFESAEFNKQKEGAGNYRVVDIRSEQAPGSFTGFGVYFPVLENEKLPGELINEGKGFDPRVSYRNIPTKLLIERGIDPAFTNEADIIVELLKSNPKIKFSKDDVITRFSEDFVLSLKSLRIDDPEFDLITPLKDEFLKVTTEEEYLELTEVYNERARKFLLEGLVSERFGEATETMLHAANVIAGNKSKLDRNNMILYSVYTLHALDFDQAVRNMTVNRFMLGRNFDDVKKELYEYYRYMKIDEFEEDDQAKDDLERFEYFLNMVIGEVIERENAIAHQISTKKSY